MGWLGGYGCGFGHGAKGTKYEKMLGSLIVESSDGKVKFDEDGLVHYTLTHLKGNRNG